MNELPNQEEQQNFWLDETHATDHGGIVIDIAKITVHPKFNPFTYEHDIDLITFKEKIRPSKDLFPVCLPRMRGLCLFPACRKAVCHRSPVF